jgi:hypothetical protein
MSELLKMTLEALHKRLDEENTILVQNEEGWCYVKKTDTLNREK